MAENALLLALAVGTIVAMTFILGWFFRRLSRIEHAHWAEKAGDSTPRWVRFLVGKKGNKLVEELAASEQPESE
ncbi:MAG: hypothetical protein QGH42_00365 [Kiritimatiellia bacterium]|nr:hypothetical protein [Kiritimatiellia bacterium]MDP7022689.1 hypothetical protein [Kiritimatiellia bacterium]